MGSLWWLEPEHEAYRCTAVTRSSGVRCKKVALVGSDRCRTHGGAGWVRQLEVGEVLLDHALEAHIDWLRHLDDLPEVPRPNS